MARVRSMIEQGVTVEQAKVIQALLGALDNANSRSKPKRCVYVRIVSIYQLELRGRFYILACLAH